MPQKFRHMSWKQTPRVLGHIIVQGLAFLIIVYRKCISPALGPRCRFYPSCSEYCYAVLKKDGLVRGLKKSVVRLCKCQPFCKGGIDLP